MEKRFAIGIPTYNRADLLIPTVLLYLNDFPNVSIHIYDNGQQKLQDILVDERVIIYGGSGRNIGVAAAWNILIDNIFQACENALILNDDIYLGKKEFIIDKLVKFSYDFIVSPLDWCAFMLPQQTFKKLGRFDENFYPAYCEDCDFEYRLKNAGMRIMRLPVLFPSVYRKSQTMEKEPELFYRANHDSKKYYQKKWGGEPGRESFKKPFNGR